VAGAIAAVALALAPASAPAARVITVGAAAPTATSCAPFGEGTTWTPYLGFVYRNVPPFLLRPGDSIAFDLGAVNDADARLEIALAPTLANGGSFGHVPSAPFTRIVANTQTPANPRGNNTIGDYELRFTVQAVYNHSGGGLIIRFGAPGAGLSGDTTCLGSGLVASAASLDPSGHFSFRFSGDDGVFPWSSLSSAQIAQFRVTEADLPAPFAVSTGAGGETNKKTKRRKKRKCVKGRGGRGVDGVKGGTPRARGSGSCGRGKKRGKRSS
jgi:hypothetical protein